MNTIYDMPGCFQRNIRTLIDIPEVSIAEIARIKCSKKITMEEWSKIPWEEKGIVRPFLPFFWLRTTNGFLRTKEYVQITDLLLTERLKGVSVK